MGAGREGVAEQLEVLADHAHEDISGGWSRSVSLSADSSTGIDRSAWNETSAPSA